MKHGNTSHALQPRLPWQCLADGAWSGMFLHHSPRKISPYDAANPSSRNAIDMQREFARRSAEQRRTARARRWFRESASDIQPSATTTCYVFAAPGLTMLSSDTNLLLLICCHPVILHLHDGHVSGYRLFLMALMVSRYQIGRSVQT